MGISQAPTPSQGLGARHYQFLLLLLGLISCNMEKYCLSLGLVAMGDPTANVHYPVINYTMAQKGIILSAYAYGNMIGSIPMGIFINKYGPTITGGLLGGVGLGLTTVLLPLSALYIGFEMVCAIRALQGFFYCCVHPYVNAMMSTWIPSHELEKFSWVWSGTFIGMLMANLIGGFLVISPGGWPSLFYVPGILSIISGIAILKMCNDLPKDHKSITKAELDYLTYYRKDVNMEGKERKARVPWCSILTSFPVWILVIAQCANYWLSTVDTGFFPIFLHGVYGFDVTTNGLLSALPGLVSLIFCNVFSYSGNRLRKHVSHNFSRKFWSTIGYLVPSILYLFMSFVKIGSTEAVILFVLIFATNTATLNGTVISQIDLSPNFAGILTSLCGALTNLTGLASSTFTGYAVSDEHNLGDWQSIFLIASIVAFMGNAIFVVFGSTSVQPWNYCNDSTDENPKKDSK